MATDERRATDELWSEAESYQSFFVVSFVVLLGRLSIKLTTKITIKFGGSFSPRQGTFVVSFVVLLDRLSIDQVYDEDYD